MTTKHPTPDSRPDLYGRVTSRIVEDLERSVRPWTKPWSAGNTTGRITRPLRHNGQPYSGINVVLLWSEAVAHGFVSPVWMTFRQALQLGGHVRKGETGSLVVYANRIRKTELDDKGDEIEREIPFLKAYTVFCADQIAHHLARFIANVRALPLDPIVLRQNWLEAYDYATDRGAATLNDHARADDPFGKVGKTSVSVEVTSVVRASESSFQLRWIERRYVNGTLAATERWTAILSIVLEPPRSEERLRKNPLGIYVNGLSWSRELGAGGS